MNPPDAAEQLEILVPLVAGTALRDQRETMERPFFSIAKGKRLKPIKYVSPDGSVYVNVTANHETGMATIWDADILIWAASVLSDMKRKGRNDIPRKLQFQPFDLLRMIGRDVGGRQYKLLKAALDRLQSTRVFTNIRAEGTKRKERQFSWISEVGDIIDTETKVSLGMTITLSDWFYEGVMQDGGVLAIDPEYFKITGGRERWLYRVARKHAGGAGKEGFAIGMKTLFEKSGAEGTYARFKFEMLKLAAADGLPGYALSIEVKDKGEPLLRMTRRELPAEQPTTQKVARSPKGPRPSKAPAAAPPMQLFRQLSDHALAQCRKEAKGFDVYGLKTDFDIWLNDDPKRNPRDYEAAFLGFVKKRAAEVG